MPSTDIQDTIVKCRDCRHDKRMHDATALTIAEAAALCPRPWYFRSRSQPGPCVHGECSCDAYKAPLLTVQVDPEDARLWMEVVTEGFGTPGQRIASAVRRALQARSHD